PAEDEVAQDEVEDADPHEGEGEEHPPDRLQGKSHGDGTVTRIRRKGERLEGTAILAPPRKVPGTFPAAPLRRRGGVRLRAQEVPAGKVPGTFLLLPGKVPGTFLLLGRCQAPFRRGTVRCDTRVEATRAPPP